MLILGGQRGADDLHDARKMTVDVHLDGDGEEADRLEGGRLLAVPTQADEEVGHHLVEVTEAETSR